MIKRILIIICTFLIAMSGFLTGFFSVGCMSVYAAVNDDSVYVPLRSQSDLVKGFQAYCKSRDLTIEGSLTDAVTTFTTGAFNSACNEIGIDITQLQAEIKAEYDSSGKPVKFLFNDTGVMAMNRIFAQFLQDNELEVGDQNVNDNVYDGYYYDDSLIWIITQDYSYTNSTTDNESTYIIHRGSYYQYDSSDVISNTSLYPANNSKTVTLGNSTYNISVFNFDNSYYSNSNAGGSNMNRRILGIWSADHVNITSGYTDVTGYGYPILIKIQNDDNVYLAEYHHTVNVHATNGNRYFGTISKKTSSVPLANTQVVNINIVSNTINNNNYEGDTYITNEGDVYYPDQEPTPKDPNDVIHNVPETPLTPNDDDGWDIDLPDIDIPNLPIGNLSEKFPFSIPWDLVAFYAMLDAEPEAPRFNGTMDLTLVQWNYDIDLSPFDSAAALCRKLQFGLFVVGLIVASRSIIRG